MPMSWNQETDARLLIAIISTTPSINWEAAAAFLGPQCTISALKHRVARLKDKAGVQGAAPRPPKTRKSGSKRSKAMKATKEDFEKAKATAKSNKKVQASSSADEDNLDGDNIDEDNLDNADSSDDQESPEQDLDLEYL